MPCTYTGSVEGDARLTVQENGKMLTEVTANLCQAMKAAERGGFLDKMPSRCRRWWEEHKKLDRQREKERRAAKVQEKQSNVDKMMKLAEKTGYKVVKAKA